MAILIYGLCALTSLACLVLLSRSYLRTRVPLLFWSALCFLFLTLNNFLLVADKIVFPDIDFSLWRALSSFAAILLLLFGLIWEEE
ncbi:MAG TPA: DUF5985 family protein [Ramlibacter sp.]|jgi:hypothetical protein|uniref:DUF5985 family protein n=1 Tax=Ramlibacter sp. TaxID=1917967 RepID=UPI002D255513|nr:DUF5985 family protein [Ramlibacter sp.]HZY16941.1 DUF5985 family protein [Ramlibacter sp.]